MASIINVPQLLIHESELNEILRIISTVKDPECKIVGNLFGLWRHSLIQPVVHLVTGPGKRAKLSRDTFIPGGVYHVGMKKYMEEQHGLLQIGLWCSGNSDRYPALNQGHTDYDLHSPILPEKGRYVVFMFVDQTPGNLEIEYRIIDRQQQELSRTAQLTAKDVLSGASSFRLMQPVVERFNQDAMFPCYENQNTGYFSSSMLPTFQQSPTALASTNGMSLLTKNGERPQQHSETDDRSNLMKKTWI